MGGKTVAEIRKGIERRKCVAELQFEEKKREKFRIITR